MLPTQTEVELPLLRALIQCGGQGKPRDIYPVVTSLMPQLTAEDLNETLPDGHSKWHNRIQWVRQRLIDQGEMESGGWGVWRITQKGRDRVASGNVSHPSTHAKSFLESYEEYETAFKAQLLDRLMSLEPTQFEHLGQRILMAYGFVQVEVTRVSRDGGIDGHGQLALGLATLNAAFQCKRWQGNVGRTEVDQFRGAIQGQFEQGIFLATSDFTAEARDASLRRGAVPIVLLNGESIVRLLIEKQVGVRRAPIHAYFDVLDEVVEAETRVGGVPRKNA